MKGTPNPADEQRERTLRPWVVTGCRPLVDRLPWLRLWEEDVRLPGGVEIHGYLRAETREYAMVFALLTDGTVPMVSQYKHARGAVNMDLPAGYLDSPDEPILEAAQRELREETGVTAPEWRHLGSLVLDSNRGDSRVHLFLATGGAVTGASEPDATEELMVSFHQPERLEEMVLDGRVDNVASAAGIMIAVAALRRSGVLPAPVASRKATG